jgi:glycosyltransferase involved in cell wall biosynthesis
LWRSFFVKILFVHQNFPGQFRNLVVALAAQGQHEVVAMGYADHKPQGAYRYVRCVLARGNDPGTPEVLLDFESKVLRAEATAQAALKLRQDGFTPDVIVGHPGWGECLYLQDVWPQARLGLYCEYFYRASGQDIGFDPEFQGADGAAAQRIRLKNAHTLMSLVEADGLMCPTRWQAHTYPVAYRQKMTVVHDGVDTAYFAPDTDAFVELDGRRLDRTSSVVTFVARHLEPCRGFHTFMRALPEILRRNPACQVIIVGDPGPGYGPGPATGTWQDVLLQEVGAMLSPERVRFVGLVPLTVFRTLMQISSAHVYLTYPFVLSWSLLQAMACGAMVVGSRTPPVEEVIDHEANGLLVDFFSPEAVAEAVTRALAGAPDIQAMRQRARDTVVARYDWATHCLPRQLEWLAELNGSRIG